MKFKIEKTFSDVNKLYVFVTISDGNKTILFITRNMSLTCLVYNHFLKLSPSLFLWLKRPKMHLWIIWILMIPGIKYVKEYVS